MAIDRDRIRRFIESSQCRTEVAKVFRRSGFEIKSVEERKDNAKLWGYFLKPNSVLEEMLGISDEEILLWVVEYSDFQARSLQQAQDIIAKNRPRLSSDFALIVTDHAETKERVSELNQQSQHLFIGISLSRIRDLYVADSTDLKFEIQQQLFAKNLYDVTNVVTTRRAFFGRDSLVRSIKDAIMNGNSQIAVFGLRKAGKTSLLLRVIELISNSPNFAIVHLDLQRIDAVRPTAEYLLWAIGEHLVTSSPAVRDLRSLRLFGRFERFPVDRDRDLILEDFDFDMRQIATLTELKVFIVFDELELISPSAQSSRWGDGFVRAWRLLRGIDQTSPGRFRYLVAGTNPTCIQQNKLGGQENPTYNYFSMQYLPPLSEQESDLLLTSLGKKMGLRWMQEELHRAYLLTGGHPLLLRQFGSAIHLATEPRKTEAVVTADLLQAQIASYTAAVSSSISQMIDVLDDSFKDDLMLLRLLAGGRLGEFREFAEVFPSEVSRLRGFGLLCGTEGRERIAIEVLHGWLQSRGARKASSETRTNEYVGAIGTVVDGYTLTDMLGTPGAFGCVFKALHPSYPSAVAFKIFHDASMEKLTREVEILSEVSHTAIVKILGHGVSLEGQVYLVTELIEGRPLKSFCIRHARMSESQAAMVLRELLNALSAIHPNASRESELRAKSGSLTSEEYKELGKVMHGFIHRDINPNNILIREKDGRPVLIDFGISSKARDSMVTHSGTSGYHPPDGRNVIWTADVDLYALGVSICQALSGTPMSELSINDLRSAVIGEAFGRVGDVALKLCAPLQADRYKSALDALSHLDQAVDNP